MYDGAGCAYIIALWSYHGLHGTAFAQQQGITRPLATATFHEPKHETVKSCPSAAQPSPAQHSTLPESRPLHASRQPMTLSPVFRIVARLPGAVPSKKFPAFHDTHPSCQRQAKLVSQLGSYSASLGCTHDQGPPPHPLKKADDDTKVRCVGSRPSRRSLSAYTLTRLVLGPSPRTQKLPRRVGQIAVQLRNSMELPLPPFTPPLRRRPGEHRSNPGSSHLSFLATAAETRPRHPAVDFETAPPSLQFETCP